MNQIATHTKSARSRRNRDAHHPRTAESSAPRTAGPPPRHKQAVVTWIGAFGAITAILALLGPMMVTWPLVLRTLLISVLMVVTLTWAVLPLLHRVFRGWLTA
jgi:antibiotic biosynthesis monooxygenase (ABM) superfamily enzyme